MFQSSIDVLDTFGPLASMHAALDRVGAGMPCGLVARFQDRSAADVESAVASAARRFPMLGRRLVWEEGRAVLASTGTPSGRLRHPPFALALKSSPLARSWTYRIVEDGKDTWLAAVWAHAGADGLSMLRFLQAVGTSVPLDDSAGVRRPARPRGRKTRFPAWILDFLAGRRLSYVRLSENTQAPGIAHLIVPPAESGPILRRARDVSGGFAGWLAGACCQAVCDQQTQGRGRILLNLPIVRDNLERVGGFGFGVGSLIMPVAVWPEQDLAPLAARITARARQMASENWDGHLDSFLGRRPWRHLLFASLRSRGRPDPTVNVSWKGDWPAFGGAANGLRDVACFGVAPTAHISAHTDRNGLSVSVTSQQSPAGREDLLRRIVRRLGVSGSFPIVDLDWLDHDTTPEHSAVLVPSE